MKYKNDKVKKEVEKINKEAELAVEQIRKITKGSVEEYNEAMNNGLPTNLTELYRLRGRAIKPYCNHSGWTDSTPYEVVNVISGQTVEIRYMHSELIEDDMKFTSGGFVGHFSNQESQKYKYESAENQKPIRARWSKAKEEWVSSRGRHSMADAPYRFYDFNF